jgi:hypothetical protein
VGVEFVVSLGKEADQEIVGGRLPILGIGDTNFKNSCHAKLLGGTR